MTLHDRPHLAVWKSKANVIFLVFYVRASKYVSDDTSGQSHNI